jgi:DNA-binding response OmpR family regulator
MSWICIVDGDPQVRDVLTDALRSAGHGVRAFGDGTDALDAIETSLEKPRLVILEALLPGLAARQVLRRIREGRHAPEVPVVVITSADVDERYFAPWSILRLMRKPIAIDALLETVADALPRRRPPASGAKKGRKVP